MKQRCRAAPLAVLLYALMSAAILWPFRGPDVKFAGDLPPIVNGIAEARNALAEGQFPIRVAPHQWDGAGYPFFQYYGNFPYTLAGALDLALPGVTAYDAWKVVTFAALIAAGVFTRRSALVLNGRGNRIGALTAGAAYIAAPYMLTDIFVRGLLGEVVAFCLLPVFFYTALQAFRRPRLRHVLAMGLTWTLVGLTHNITYFYASLFIGAFFLSLLRVSKRGRTRCVRLGVAAVLHAALIAWYFVPQIATLDQLNIGLRLSPYNSPGRAPLGVLLAATQTSPPGVPGTSLGVQVGWPILAGVIGAVIAAIAATSRKPVAPKRRLARTFSTRMLVLFLIALLMAWSPVDLWRWLPGTFSYVQFPYRLLMFCVLWGTLLIAFSMRGRRVQGVASWPSMVCMSLIGLAASTYRPATLAGDPNVAATAAERPVMSGLADYRLRDGSPGVAASDLTAVPVNGGTLRRFRVNAPVASRVRIPVLFYPGMLRVRVDREPVAYRNSEGFIAVDVPPGQHTIDAVFVGVGWANAVSLTAWLTLAAATVVTTIARRRRRRRWSRRGRGRGRGRSDGRRSRLLDARALLATAACFGFFAIGLRLPAIYGGIRDWIDPPIQFKVTASRPSPPQYAVQNAFDGNRQTEWAATGSDPISLAIDLARPQVLDRIALESRGLGLYEGWEHVRVDLFREGQRVESREIDMPDAWRQRVVTIDPPHALATRVELHFSSPNTRLLDGRDVGPAAVNPGYTEIRLAWTRR